MSPRKGAEGVLTSPGPREGPVSAAESLTAVTACVEGSGHSGKGPPPAWGESAGLAPLVCLPLRHPDSAPLPLVRKPPFPWTRPLPLPAPPAASVSGGCWRAPPDAGRLGRHNRGSSPSWRPEAEIEARAGSLFEAPLPGLVVSSRPLSRGWRRPSSPESAHGRVCLSRSCPPLPIRTHSDRIRAHAGVLVYLSNPLQGRFPKCTF